MKGRRPSVLTILAISALYFMLLAPMISAQETKQPIKKEGQKQETPATQPQSPPAQSAPAQTPPQEVQKPRLDYMSTFLSRDTTPLGLKEDQEIRQLLKESRAKWMVRAGLRSILN
mgnify:FL=1|jgi:hypothetical protein